MEVLEEALQRDDRVLERRIRGRTPITDLELISPVSDERLQVARADLENITLSHERIQRPQYGLVLSDGSLAPALEPEMAPKSVRCLGNGDATCINHTVHCRIVTYDCRS